MNPRGPVYKPDLGMMDPTVTERGAITDHRTSGADVLMGVGVHMGVGVRVMDTTDEMVTRPSVSVPQVDIPDVRTASRAASVRVVDSPDVRTVQACSLRPPGGHEGRGG